MSLSYRFRILVQPAVEELLCFFFFFFSFIDLIRLVFSIASSTPTHYDRFLRQRPFLFTFFFFLRFIVVHDFFPTV